MFIIAGNWFTSKGTELMSFGSELAQLISLKLMSDEKEVVPPYAMAFTRKEMSVTWVSWTGKEISISEAKSDEVILGIKPS